MRTPRVRTRWRFVTMMAISFAIIVTSAALGLTTGAPRLSLDQALVAALDPQDSAATVTVVHLRIPRILLALCAGAALSVAGAMMQDIARNPLASPDLIGVTQGASLTVAIVSILHLPVLASVLPVLALAGGLFVGLVVLFVARRIRSALGIALIGLATSSALSGAIVAVLSLGSPADIGLLTSYLLGSLANRSWDAVALVAPWTIVGLGAAFVLARQLDALRLGDEVAHGLGVRPQRARMLVLIVCSGLVAAVVSACGPIGFVALLVPHLVRSVVRTSAARVVLIASALVGAAAVVAADSIGAALVQPREIAVGAWLALFGGPLLLLVLRPRRVS